MKLALAALAASPLLAIACANLIGISDVPKPSDGGLGGDDVGAPGADSGSAPPADSASDAQSDGSDGCAPSAQRCAGSGVEVCGANGQWGAPSACATNMCSGGSCAGSTNTGSSCRSSSNGPTKCGAGSESCCTSPEVAGGTFFRTYSGVDGGVSGEADPATVSGFRLDKYLVTVGRFRQFVTAWSGGAGYLPPARSGKHTHVNGGLGLANSPGSYEPGWLAADDSNVAPTNANLACAEADAAIDQTWTASAGANENLPMSCVNWWESYAFCIWDGGFLPSEAEWEYAAAGGSQQRQYPWGSMAPGSGTQYAIYCATPSDLINGACGVTTEPAAVGIANLGVGLWGQLDLEGNVGEWDLDWYADAYPDPCVDCGDLVASAFRVTKGAYYDALSYYLTSSFHNGAEQPAARSPSVGVRCARTP